MQGSRKIEDLYEFFRRTEFKNCGGPAMLLFLDLVADILQSRLLFFGTSLTSLCLSRVATPDLREDPFVAVCSDGECYNFAYVESWQDSPYFRSREDKTRCTIEHARTALLEFLARLKPKPLP